MEVLVLVLGIQDFNLYLQCYKHQWSLWLPVSTADKDGRRRARWRRILWWRHQRRMRYSRVRQTRMHRSKDSGWAQPRQLVIWRVRRSKRHAISTSTRPSSHTHTLPTSYSQISHFHHHITKLHRHPMMIAVFTDHRSAGFFVAISHIQSTIRCRSWEIKEVNISDHFWPHRFFNTVK